MLSLEKLTSIEYRGQTDRVTALPRPYALDIDLWPWPMTLTFNPGELWSWPTYAQLKLPSSKVSRYDQSTYRY